MVLTQLAVPLLAERRGLIVNITSDAATAAYPGWGPYGATKAALELLTRTLAAELREQGVSAVLVDPGDMRTRMHQEAFPGEDISDRPLPEVTMPFWNWLFDQDPQTRSRPAVRRPAGGCAMAAAGVIDAFTLPAHLEAAEPPEARGLRRDDVRLLVSHVDADSIAHSRFSDLPRWLAAGDLLVVNTSGTLNAALDGDEPTIGETFELHLSTRLPGDFWVVEVRRPGPVASLPYRDARAGTTFDLDGGGRAHAARAVSAPRRVDARSRLWIAALAAAEPVAAVSRTVRPPDSVQLRQAAVGRRRCTRPSSPPSPAARRCRPPARPFTAELVTRLVVARRPDRAAAAAHRRREPRGSRAAVRGVLSRAAGDRRPRQRARRAGRRVVAVGTTVVRALETVTDDRGRTSPGEGWTSLVITPERPLRVGQRDDHRPSRTARHAPGDGRTGDGRGRRRAAGGAPRSRLPRGAAGGISVARVRRFAPDHRAR